MPNLKIGKLTILGKAPHKDRHEYWKYLCDCGTIKIGRKNHILSGGILSCGCSRHTKSRTHAMSKTSIYRIWSLIKDRCTNPKNPAYKNYGGRGIYLASEWNNFEQFYFDMGNPPSAQYSIDRRDNNEGYYKENCYWATRKEQANNKRNNVNFTYNDETKTLAQWSELKNWPYHVIRGRIRLGWPIEKAIETEYKPKPRRSLPK